KSRQIPSNPVKSRQIPSNPVKSRAGFPLPSVPKDEPSFASAPVLQRAIPPDSTQNPPQFHILQQIPHAKIVPQRLAFAFPTPPRHNRPVKDQTKSQRPLCPSSARV